MYKTLSKKGNPRLETLAKVLHAVGLRISVTPEVTM
ncbi:DNA-binding protein [Candidatus Scalindua japonica]